MALLKKEGRYSSALKEQLHSVPSEVCALALRTLIANKHSCRTLHENRALSEKKEKRRGKDSSFYVSAATFRKKTAHVPTAYTHSNALLWGKFYLWYCSGVP